MAEQLSKTGVVREPGYMYFVKNGDVWRVPRKLPGEPKGEQELVAKAGFAVDPDFIYYLGKDGHVWRSRRAIGSKLNNGPPDHDQQDEIPPEAESQGSKELLYQLFDDLKVPASTVALVEVRDECARLFDEVRSLAELRGLTPRQFEHLLAEVFSREGYETHLTPATRDGGRDVIAVLPGPLPVLVVAEAKHMALVPPALVHSLAAVRDRDRAHVGLLATTGRFSSNTREEVRATWRRWIELKDGEEFMAWLSKVRSNS